MRQIERTLEYFGIILLIIFLFHQHDLELYLLIVIGITINTFRFINYNKNKKYTKLSEPLIIPMKTSNYFLHDLFIIVVAFGIMGFYYYLGYINIIELRRFNYLGRVVFTIVLPILATVKFIKFSDLSDTYLITNIGIISGFRYNDFTKRVGIDSFVVDKDKAIIKIQKGKRVLLKMKIDRKYFNDNIDKISEELKIYVAS